MKLSIVQLRDQVPAGSVGNNTSRLMEAEGPGPSQGWELVADFTKRVVFASKAGRKLVVPFENAPWMEPAVEVPAAKAKSDKAA